MTEVAGITEATEVETAAPITTLPTVRELSVPATAGVAAVRMTPAANPTTTKSPPAVRDNLIARLSARVGGILPHVQYQLTRLGALGITGIAAVLGAAVITLTAVVPGHSAIRALDADIARSMRHAPSGETTPEEGLAKLVAALPTRGQIPAVIGLVLQQAHQAGVPLDVGHYAFIPAKAGSVGRYELEFPVRASYPQVRDFINRTLTAVPAASLDKLRIERKSVTDQAVNADVRFVVFVRGE